MLRSFPSSASSPACALSPPETPPEGVQRKNEGFGKSYQHYLADQGPARSQYQGQRPRKQNEQPEYLSNDWRSGSYDSSNASWESDWSASRGGTIKSESPGTTAFYKYRNTTGSYQSGTDWSGDLPVYGVMQHSQQSSSNSPSASSSSYYDSNDYYNYGYDQNARGGPPSGYQQYGAVSQQQYQGGAMSGPYNGNRNPSTCPPTPGKQQEYQRRQTRYGMEGVLRTQIKREPDAEGGEVEGENFTSLFTKSLTSLYSQDTENTYGEDSKTYDSDIMICTPSSSVSPIEDNTYQRLGPPPQGQYNPGYPNQMRNNFGFYENRPPNCETNVVQELGGSGPDRSNSFRYDRPSFDDMHLYASSPPESKSQTKKRKLSMPNIGPEGKNYPSGEAHPHPRRKAPRGMSFKSEAQWTPNSFAFSDVQIKQEPLEDYTTEDMDSQNRNMMQYKDNSVGNGNVSKSPGSQSEHNKAPPRKRSPGSTCFDRFEKKSTPQSKKVSPLSVYAKVQECIVLNVKCRRYKKRTRPANAKEEVVYPGKEEIENWKRTGAYSESPDQAVRHLMGDMLEKVSHYGARTIDKSGPDLSQIDVLKVRELLYQFCQRYTLDYRDFEDIDAVLRPNIIKDKTAKNSLRASAIRKRTSVSPARPKQAPEPETKPPKMEKVVKKSNTGAPKQAERRVLRSLPGRPIPVRVDRSRQTRRRTGKTPVARRRYSTRSAKDVEETSDHSDVDIIIDSSTDRESEAGKEAEVRKTSQRLKNKQPPPVETPAKEESKPPTKILRNSIVKLEEQPRTRTRSREKKEAEKLKESVKAAPKKKWSRLHVSENSMSSSGDSVEIISATSSSTRNLEKESKTAGKIEPLPKSSPAAKTSERIANRNLKQNDEASRKSFKAADDSKISKSDEPIVKSSKRSDETVAKNSKSKVVSARKTTKNEEPSSNKVSTRRSEKAASSKKSRQITRRKKVVDVEKNSITIEDDSCHSKSDDDSSSKVCEKELGKTVPKENDESSSESKDTISEPEKSALDKTGSKSSETLSVAKDLKTNKDESENTVDVSDDSENNASLTSSDSTKPVDVEKTKELTSDREQIIEKPFKFSFLNDRSESTLQVKLNRLPLKLDSKKRILPIESQDFFHSMSKPKINLESNSCSSAEGKGQKDLDLLDPPELVCMKEPEKEIKEEAPHQEKSGSSNPPSNEAENAECPKNLVANSTEPVSKDTELNKPPNDTVLLGKPLPIARPRYSESEDSDCGLVIDLDRRLSVEERVPTPTFQNTSENEKKRESKEPNITLDLVKKEPSITPPVDENTSQTSNSFIPHRMEDDCILLPPSEDPLRLDSHSASFLESTAKSLSFVESDLERAKKLKDQDESILRTLLLETADVSSGVSQELLSQNNCDAASDISADSKASISQDVMKLLMYQTYNEVSPLCGSPGFDEKKITLDQLTADVADEECSRDPRFLKEQMKKLKNEIVYLQCMIDQKDKERTAIICFKRYKEEVLKRVVKQYAASVQLRDWIRARQESTSSERSSTERSSSDRVSSRKPAPIASASASTSSSASSTRNSDSPHPQLSPSHSQVISLAYHSTVNTDVPAPPIVSDVSKKSPTQCSESLPTVATMIAKATENYGVDMRTMRNGTSTTQTILQKVLSSKESIYSPTACRSPSSDKSTSSKTTTHHQQQSVQIFQKTLSSTRESCYSPAHCRSPSLPELHPGPPKSSAPSHPQLLHKALSSKDPSLSASLSPPNLQPELRQTKSLASPPSSVQKQPLDLIVTSAEKLKMSSSKSHDSIPTSGPKSSPERNSKRTSSPKRSSSTSYSAWSSIHSRTSLSATTTTTIDLRTDHTRTSQEPLPLSKRPHSRNTSHSSNGQGFMVVPPPIMLQQSQKSSIVHQSRSESVHPHDKSLKNSVERIYSRKTEEERRTMSYSSSLLSTSNSLPYNSSHKIVPHVATSNGNSIQGSIKTISQPVAAAANSNTPRCMGCGLSHAKFLCSGCRSHWYCSHECQSMRWPEHSQTCVGNVGVYNQTAGSNYS